MDDRLKAKDAAALITRRQEAGKEVGGEEREGRASPDLRERLEDRVERGVIWDGRATRDAPSRPDRLLYAIYIRATAEEKRRIYARARECELSVSRFLVRVALDEKTPPTQEDRRRLEFLITLFKETELSLKRLSVGDAAFRILGATPETKAILDQALRAVSGLIRELERRL